MRALRQQRGLSQEELAFSCDLDRTYIGSVERGERNISLVNIHTIAAALGFHQRNSLMTKRQPIPAKLLQRVKTVTNKRARYVLDEIVKNGKYFDHPTQGSRV